MPSVETILANVLQGQSAPDAAPSASAAGAQDFDVASFVDQLGKTAGLLDKAAEALPTTPEMFARNLKLLDSPLEVTRQEMHDQHRGFFGQVLPEAKASLQVPRGIDDIQKVASVPAGSFLLSRLSR